MSVSVPRLATVWCPAWPVAAALEAGPGQPRTPIVVVHATRVVAASLTALADDVQPGLRRRAAQARCPSLVVIAHDPGRDAVAFDRVARAVEVLTPRLEITEPGTATFLARGPSRYHGGDEAMARYAMILATTALGDAAGATGPPGVGVADGRFTALIAARLSASRGEPVVVPPGGAAAFLAPISVTTLPDPDLVDLLGRLGLHSLG